MSVSSPSPTRLWGRAGLSGAVTRAGGGTYVDRHDNIHLPAIAGYRLARAFASRDPEGVLRYIAEVEDRLTPRT